MVVNDIYVRDWGTYNWCIIFTPIFLSTIWDKARGIIFKIIKMPPVVNFHSSILQMESLHILIAIFFVCLTTSFCFELFTWQFFRSTNHAITVLANYYSAFETRLKRIEHNINTLNSIFSQPQSSSGN